MTQNQGIYGMMFILRLDRKKRPQMPVINSLVDYIINDSINSGYLLLGNNVALSPIYMFDE